MVDACATWVTTRPRYARAYDADVPERMHPMALRSLRCLIKLRAHGTRASPRARPQARSKIAAMPWPPPMHIVTSA